MRKNKRSSVELVKKSSIVATEIALACMSVQFAYAQQQAAAERVERVEITGTRLPAISTEGPSPVAVMNAEEIRMDGLAKPEDLLRNLPQVFDSQSTTQANGATGTAQVNLRNLGADRNLVLVNGRRLPPGSPRQGGYAADLNQIPTPLIQRVELLTGGASAVYGSDAISGVVNFILNDRFEGVQLDYYHSFAQHEQQNGTVQDIVRARAATNPQQFQVPGDVEADGRINGLSLLMGKNFADNKGNGTVFFHYKKESAVRQRERDFSACALDPDSPPTGTGNGDKFLCGGSSTAFPGRFALPGALGVASGGSRTVADDAGNTRAFAAATDQFNFGPYNYFRRPSTQYGANAFLNFDLHPQVRLYSELGFHDNRTNAVIAPSGIFFGVPFTIFSENPLLPAGGDWRARFAAANAACTGGGPVNCPPGTVSPGFNAAVATGDFTTLLIGRRNIEGGGRDDDIRHTSTRGVVGAKGDFAKHWNYDVFAQLGNVYYQSVYRNEFSTQRTTRALDVITDPATGQPACRSFVDGTDPNCVPYNLWSLGQITPGALNYIQVNGVRNGDTRQDVVGASVRTDLGNYGLKLPSAKNGVGFVLGIERRRESLRSEPDALFESNDLAGQGGATIGVQGELGVREIFTEFGIPIIEGRPFADLLAVNLSYRYSDYTTDKQTNTYGIGAEWAPTKTVKTRGSYQHAVRHANITELFLGQGTNLFDMDEDPCGPAMAATAAQCANSGLNPALYGSPLLDSPAGQYQFLQGGVATLNPEKADTYTFGIVLTPARDFSATLDYWNIKIDDAIDAPSPSSLLTGCLNTGANCNLIQRDPATGVLWFGGGRVVALNANIGGYHADGLDVALNYLLRMGGLGSFGFNFAGSWLNKWEYEPIKGAGKFDCTGLYGANCSFNRGPLPEWRHKFRLSWAMPWNLDVAATWRHIHKVDHENTSGQPELPSGIDPVNRTLGARDYLDLALAWNITKIFSLRAGVNNVFDKDPPIVSQGVSGPSVLGNGNTFPGTYDAFGRVFFFNVGMKL